MTTKNATERAVNVKGLFYGMLALSDTMLWQVISSWQNYYYFPEDGPALIPVGTLYVFLMFLNAIFGIFIGLPIGHWSDRVRTRWGRRIPFMFLTGVPRLILFVMLWTPPHQNQSLHNLIYLTLVLLSHGFIASLQQIPSDALLPELARTDQERVQISAWVSAMGLVGMVVSSFAGMGIEQWGYVKTVSLYALIALPLFYLPLFVLREAPKPLESEKHELNIRQSFSLILRNQAFMIFIVIQILGTSSMVLLQTMFPFIVTRVFQLSMGDTMYFFMIGLIANISCYPLMTWLAKRWGKRRIYATSLLSAAIVLPSLLLIGDWIPLPLFAVGVIWVILEAISLSGSAVLGNAFIAEIIDYDATITGQRREGAYYAALDFVDRIVYSMVAMLPPILLTLGSGPNDGQSLLGVKLAGGLGGSLTFIAFLVFQRYPLKKQSTDLPGS